MDDFQALNCYPGETSSMDLRFACGLAIAIVWAASAMAQDQPITNRLMVPGVQAPTAPEVSSPPAEAFRVFPPPGAERPQITPYLLYQTSLAWNQDELRRNRWSKVRNEDDLLRLRDELRGSLLEMRSEE